MTDIEQIIQAGKIYLKLNNLRIKAKKDYLKALSEITDGIEAIINHTFDELTL